MTVYLDHAATTPLREEARAAWERASHVSGNPASIHGGGQEARRMLEDSRERLAAALDCDPVEVVFTSGGTEAINLAITGLWRSRRGADRAAIVMPTAEHHATIDTVQWLEKAEGARIRLVEVDGDAQLADAGWRDALAVGDAALATMLAANNEVGTLQPVIEAARTAAEHGVPLHVDAVGAFGHMPLSFRRWRSESGSRATGLVALSVAAHKIAGPVGIGALVVARDATIEPLLHGGGHQRGIRPGTQDVAGAAAFAVAAELAVAELASESERVGALRARFEAGMRSLVADAIVSATGADRLPGHSHLVFPGAQGDSLLLLLDMDGIAVSTGSACQAGVPEPSHVVRAMGRSDAEARSTLRITFGRTSTADDVDRLLAVLPAAYVRARRAGLSSREVR